MAKTETNRIEYKETLADNFEKAAVAFLNSDGGDIFIGIRNDGSIVGVPDPDTLQLKIVDKLKDNIRPSVMGLFDVITETRAGKTKFVPTNAASNDR